MKFRNKIIHKHNEKKTQCHHHHMITKKTDVFTIKNIEMLPKKAETFPRRDTAINRINKNIKYFDI